MEQDIHVLIKRFMAGLTTREEEDRLAAYFRQNEVDEELLPYKRLFAWFDEGMPSDSLSSENAPAKSPSMETSPGRQTYSTATPRPVRLRKWAFVIMAAAAVALLLVMVWPHAEPQSVTNHVAQSPSPVSEEPVASQDTLVADTASLPKPKKEKPRRIKPGTFQPMPPKVYLAEALPDSISEEAQAQAERAVAEAEREQEEILKAVYEEYRRTQIGIDLYITAMENYEVEEELY